MSDSSSNQEPSDTDDSTLSEEEKKDGNETENDYFRIFFTNDDFTSTDYNETDLESVPPLGSNPFSFLLEGLFDRELVNYAMEESMNTYSKELFRKQDTFELNLSPKLLSKEFCQGLDEEDKKCRICLEMMQVEERIVTTLCKHTFHWDCLQNMVSHQHKVCPCCRHPLPIIETHKNESGHHIRFNLS